jgi:hypothetical protein
MRAICDPNYRYSPWTPERRQAASEKAKAWWAQKREREKRDAEHYKETGFIPLKHVTTALASRASADD